MSWKTKNIIPILSKISPVLLKYRKSSSRLLILAYHRVLRKKHNFLFDEGVISASPEAFEEQVKFCKKYFSLIGFQQLKESLESKIILPPNPLIITFDDGYRDNYEYAYPILKKYNVLATIFLSTGYIGTNRLFWWDEIAYIIKKTFKNKIILKDNSFKLNNLDNRKIAINLILKYVKNISDEVRRNTISQLKDDLKVRMPEDINSTTILNWDQVREMSLNGIEFGSHTVNHPILSNCKEEQMKYEIEYSKNKIEKEIGKKVIVFSYPVGGENSFNLITKGFIEKAEYEYAVNYIHGLNRLNNLSKLCLNRIHVERSDNLSVFKSKIVFPQLVKY